MRRREFILAGGATIAWPLAAWAQQPKRRIGVLMSMAADDPEGQARFAAFLDGLQKLGWTNGRNVRIDTRWPLGDGDRSRSAEELVALAPDLILASASARLLAACRSCSRMSSTRLALGLSRASRGQAATPRDLRPSDYRLRFFTPANSRCS
jgi:hypothetical protein